MSSAFPRERERINRHLASYTLEIGTWYATCRHCGHRVQDTDRRRTAALFRYHIQEMAAKERAQLAPVIELRNSSPAEEFDVHSDVTV